MGLRRNPSLPPRPSLLERLSFRKDLNKVPAAACWDYAEIPLLVQACLREGERERIARMPSADLGITQKSPSPKARGRLWVFEVGERSEVGALESQAKLGSLEILDILEKY